MKKELFLLLAVAATLTIVGCRKDNIKPVEPIVPQGEVTREFLSRIRVA